MRFFFSYLCLLFGLYINQSYSAGVEIKPEKYDFSFNNFYGRIDKNSAQRGLRVYIEICSSCHGLKHLAFRSLQDIGYDKSQVDSIAAQFMVDAVPNEEGIVEKRKAKASDYFVDPYPNSESAKIANNGAYPPDLTLMIKARKDGPNYIRSLLLGYEDPPDGFDVGEGYYNKYMPGQVIAMPQPLYGDDVEYQDGTNPTMEQEVLDLVTFLTWASMPEIENRRMSGLKVILFLIAMTIIFYLSYRKIWSDIK